MTESAKWMRLALLAGLASTGAATLGSRAAQQATVVANPVTSTVKMQLDRFAKIMVAAAESMPAEKYGFKPTPEMNTFGHLTMHIAQSNNSLCSKFSGAAMPESKLADTDPKEKLVAALKSSFEFCNTALTNADDSKLGDPVLLSANRPYSRAGILITLSDDWYDHYGTQAVYLRLNGILPPTAQRGTK